MIFINTIPQTLANVGDPVVFNSNPTTRCNPNIRHRAGSGIFSLRGSGCPCNPARYRLSFHGNVSGVTGPAQLAVYLDGEQLPETVMSVVSAATGNTYSVDVETEISDVIGEATVSIRTLTEGLTVETASLIIERKA